jgi:MoxR-like ATPase
MRLPEPVATAQDILTAREIVREVPIAAALREHIGRIILATHPQSDYSPSLIKEYVEYGASPRAAIALVMGAKANAFLAGEINVRREDIRAVYRAALTHRLVLNFRGEAEGVSVDTLLDEVWSKAPLS